MAFVIKITREMKRQFQSEVTEHLNQFEKMLLILEKEPQHQESLHSAFRSIHSIKGNSDYLGLKDINTLAHDLEDIMDDLRGGKTPVSFDVLKVLFEVLDILRDINRRIIDEDYKETDISDIQARIQQIRQEATTRDNIQKTETDIPDHFSDVLEQEIKVDIEKIDRFMNHVIELTISKNRLRYLTEKVQGEEKHIKWLGELKQVSDEINRISDNLQTDMMKLRLIKINTIFDRLPRMVRDLSYKSGKKIHLSLSGGETEIERKTIEQLVDPLIHLIRNSVDHGIEFPQDRLEKNKPEYGTITVTASQEGNQAIIDVMDDGKGINPEHIKQTALKKKLFTSSAFDDMNDEEIIHLVFMPGFSTRSTPSAVSGRGVGLDVVKNNIKALGGSVSLSNKDGFYTRIRLKLPVAMSVTEVLLIEVCGRIYAFPFASILKTLKIQKKDIKTLNKTQVIVFDGQVLPIHHLGECLEIIKRKSLSQEEIFVLVILCGKRIQGIIVDRILKRESLLIKPLEKYLAHIKEFSGAALLGDGTVVLVIDPGGIRDKRQEVRGKRKNPPDL